MKYVSLVISVIIAGLIAVGVAFNIYQVPVGYVGVQYSAKGVLDETLSQGWHLTSPFVHVKKYPVSQQRIVFSNNPEDYDEDKHADWHIDAPTSDGATIKMNMSVNYFFESDRVIDLYKRFAGADGNALMERYIQNDIISYTKEVTKDYSAMAIYSEKLPAVNQAIADHLNDKLNDTYGIKISSVSIIKVKLSDELQQKLQDRENAKADAETAALEKQTAIAQAETKKAKAQAEADVAEIEALSKANVKKISADADAYAKKKVAESITPEYIKLIEAEARKEHGWVTINGANTIIKDSK